MPLYIMLEVEPFNYWGIDLVGPFPQSNSYLYIPVYVNYVTEWVEAIASSANDARTITGFLKNNIFSRFGVPKVLINGGGTRRDMRPRVVAVELTFYALPNFTYAG